MLTAVSSQLPPRITRLEPTVFQSKLYCHTFPLISYKPRAFADLPFTSLVTPPELAEFQPTSPVAVASLKAAVAPLA